MNISRGMLEHLPKEIGHFQGCLDGLSVNGRKLGWRDVAKMNAANLAKCQPKGEAKASEEEEAKTGKEKMKKELGIKDDFFKGAY